MKGSLTAVMSTSSCSTLRDTLVGSWDEQQRLGEMKNSRVAEDDPANATEAVDADLRIVRRCQWLLEHP
jgi:hypothetical protein